MQMAICYASKGQSHPLQIFQNKVVSSRFNKFLQIMKVNDEEHTYNSEWRGHALIWHLSHCMDEEQVRRYIANTQCIIIFHDVQHQEFDPKDINNAGAIAQFFVIVQPLEECYRIGVIHRETLKTFGPKLPYKYLFQEINLRDYILNKVHNGYIMSRSCPPFNKMYEYPRGEAIKEFAEKWAK